MHMNIEAKRLREEGNFPIQDRLLNVYRQRSRFSELKEVYVNLHSTNELKAMIDDFTYLTRYPNLTSLTIDCMNNGEYDDMAFRMGRNLQQSSVTSFVFKSRVHILRGFDDVEFGRNLIELKFVCAVQINTVFDAPFAFPRLTTLSLGIDLLQGLLGTRNNRFVHEPHFFRSYMNDGWCRNLLALTNLDLTYFLFNEGVQIVPRRIGPAMTHLTIRYTDMGVGTKSYGTAYLPDTLTHVNFLFTAFTDPHFVVYTLLAPCKTQLRTMMVSNTTDQWYMSEVEKASRNALKSDFGNATLDIDASYSALDHIDVEDVNMDGIRLRAGSTNEIFAALTTILASRATSNLTFHHYDIEMEDFLPVLSEVSLASGDNDYFPLELLGVPHLSYSGTYKVDKFDEHRTIRRINVDLDRYLPPVITAEHKRIARKLPQESRVEIYSERIRLDLEEDEYDEDEEEEQRLEMQQSLVRQRERRLRGEAALRPDWQLYLDQHTLTPEQMPFERWNVLRQQQAGLTAPLQPYRADPYFIRWRPNLGCVGARAIPDPFEPFGSSAAPQYHTCGICRDTFNRASHDADAAEITDNTFLDHRAELELAQQEDRLGCVVVCNVLPSDARAVAPDAGDDILHQLQCDHYRHFFHRVCYAVTLFHGYRCPLARTMAFLRRPHEEEDAAYARRQAEQVDREVRLDLDLDSL